MTRKKLFIILIIVSSICAYYFYNRDIVVESLSDITSDKIVQASDINKENLLKSLDLMQGWLFTHSHDSGKIEYKYWPRKDKYSTSNNMIRQFMTSHALGELYNFNKNEKLLELWQKNSVYNFNKYYLEDGENGYIIFNEKSKLGAVAVAAMSLISVDNYELATPYRIVFKKLINSIQSVIQPDFSFKTFFGPTTRNDNQAFYPGEALTALSYAAEKGVMTLDYQAIKMIKLYYMNWWRDNDKELAFIPWHTQAYYRLYKQTGEEHYVESIFEMNDFLITCQTSEEDSEGDPRIVGRYYKKGCTQYGPPHVSSTGVYTEGLAYAYALAKENGYEERAEKYKNAIILGLRSILQMQITEKESKKYPKPDLALGGMREKVTDHEIRVDNVQHAIMAILAVLKFDIIKPSSYEESSI